MVPAWQFGLVGILTVALVTDLQTRRIYNWLTFPAMAVGLALNTALGGLAGFEASLIGFAAGTIVFLVGFLINAMGAGDVKLMAAIGLWLGWPSTVAAVIYVTVVGGVISLVAAAVSGSLVRLVKNVYWFMMGLFLPGGNAAAAIQESAAPPIPYGVSIALGTLLALFFPDLKDLLHALRVG